MSSEHQFETLCLHAGQEPDPATLSRAVPVHRTTSFVFRDIEHAANLFALKEPGNIYTRIMNPTQEVLEKRVAALEGGAAALALSSGTSAVHYAVINTCAAGDEIVSASNLYGGTYTMFDTILPQFGIRVRFADPRDPHAFEAAISVKTRALFVETIGNPALEVTDLEAVAQVARRHHLPLIVDGTFTTPFLMRSIAHGADVVVNSLTKWMGGHGTASGGCPFSAHMDFKPNGVMRLIQLGLKTEALTCNTIWICVGCHTCSTQCPVGIDIAAVMDALREKALAEGAHVPEPDILDFHREVLGSIERHGRTHKLQIMLRYKLRTGDLFGDLQVGLKMLAKRKLDLTPSRVSRIDEVKKLFMAPVKRAPAQRHRSATRRTSARHQVPLGFLVAHSQAPSFLASRIRSRISERPFRRTSFSMSCCVYPKQ